MNRKFRNRVLSAFIALQTALSSMTPLAAHAQLPNASPRTTWADELDTVLGQHLTLENPEDGSPVRLGQALENGRFPREIQIRPRHDLYLPEAYIYRLVPARRAGVFKVVVFRKTSSGNPEKEPFSLTYLQLTPPSDDGTVVSAGDWLKGQLQEQKGFFTKLRSISELENNFANLKAISDQQTNGQALGALFLLSVVSAGAGILMAESGRGVLGRTGSWALMILGTGFLVFSTTMFGLNHDHNRLATELSRIEAEYRDRLSRATDTELLFALETRASELAESPAIAQGTPRIRTSSADTALALTVVGAITPLMFLAVASRASVQSNTARAAIALFLGITGYAIGIRATREARAANPELLQNRVTEEIEHIFR